MPVLITNYHIIDDNFLENKKLLKLSIDDNLKVLNINGNSKIYSSPRNKYDIMIIKLSKQDLDEFKNYLELESSLFNKDSEKLFQDEPIYILHYPNNDEISVSYGVGIEKINEFDIKHLCNTCNGSSGSPIFHSLTHKVIGIHKGFVNRKNKKDKFNIGTFLKFPLNELIESKNYFSKSPNKSDIAPMNIQNSYDKLKKISVQINSIISEYDNKNQMQLMQQQMMMQQMQQQIMMHQQIEAQQQLMQPHIKEKYNVIFKTTLGKKDNLAVDYDMTVEELLNRYINDYYGPVKGRLVFR